MGKVATLGDVIYRLSEFDNGDVIYASEPWTEHSEAMVVRDPDNNMLSLQVSNAGMKYFLEISIARDFVEDWLSSLDDKPTNSMVCRRVVEYAINDA